jgi:hypothetical protein
MSYAYGRFGSLGDWWDDLTGGGDAGGGGAPPEEAIPQGSPESAVEQACMAAGNIYNPLTGQCLSQATTTAEVACKNVGMLWQNGVCVDPLAGQTKPGTGPLEPGGPGTPGWGQQPGQASAPSGGGGPAPLAKAAISPWLIGGVVGLGALLIVGFASKKKTETAAANRRRYARSAHANRRTARCSSAMEVQTLILPKSKFSKPEAKSWAKKHGFKYGKVDSSGPSLRFRQAAPSAFQKSTFRTISMGRDVKAVVACPR